QRSGDRGRWTHLSPAQQTPSYRTASEDPDSCLFHVLRLYRLRTRLLGSVNNLARHAPTMYFTRAIVDTESTHIHKDAHDLFFCRHALPPENLHAAVDHPPLGFRTDDLGST